MTLLASYLAASMATWTHLPADCTQNEQACVTWEHWHHEPADAARVRFGEIAEQVANVAETPRQAVDLLSIAFEESGFDRLVDDGTCNSPDLVAEMHLPWHCDHGWARSVWQLHDREVDPSDRTIAISKALSLYKRAPEAWSTWALAKSFAARWWSKHPFVVT